jgi:WD40 repeat protein
MKRRALPVLALPLALALPMTLSAAGDPASELQLVGVHGVPDVAQVRFSDDGRLLVTAGDDDLVRVYDARTLRPMLRFGHLGARIDRVAVHPWDGLIAAGDRDGVVVVYDADSGQETYRYGGNGRPILAVDWSRDGDQTGIAALHGPVQVLDAHTGRPLQVIRGPAEWFARVTFDLEHDRVAATGEAGHVRVWRTDTGRLEHTLEVGGVDTTQMAFSPDGAWLATGDWDGHVRVWDLATGALDQRITGAGQTGGLAFTQDGRVLLRGPDDSVLISGSGRTGSKRMAPPPRWTGLPSEETETEWAPEVHTRADADVWGDRLAEAHGDSLRIWDLSTRTVTRELDTGLAEVRAVAVSPDGALVASLDRVGVLRVREAHSGAIRAVVGLPDGPGRDIAWSPDGRMLAISGPDRLVRVWEPLAGEPLRTLFGHTDDVTQVAWLPTSQLATASLDGTVRVWDVRSKRELRHIIAWEGGVGALAISPSGRIALWPATETPVDPDTPDLIGRPTDAVRVHASDGSRSATQPTLDHGAGDGAWTHDSTELLSIDGTELVFVKGSQELRSASTARLLCVATSPDGALIAGGTQGGTVVLLDAKTGTLLKALRGHAGPVLDVGFSADGRTLASGSADGTVRVWQR